MFIPTGNLNTARSFYTATLLNDGKVLVAGGQETLSGSLTATTELYDPATGTFTPTGSMSTPRISASATLLNNGMVLIAGGGSSSAELYDPAAGSFTLTGSMTTGRTLHTATLLNNGTVLVVGGGPCSSAGCFLATAELYDPATGTFTTTGSLNTPRVGNTATLLNNGTVLIAGGEGGGGITPDLASAELYDPVKGTFTFTGNMSTSRFDATATLLNNGTVLIAGGINIHQTLLATTELYDPATGMFALTGSLSTARFHHTATLLNNGMVLIAGGLGQTPYLASTELYVPTSGSFTPTGSLSTGRSDHTATLLSNGTVLVAGGYDNAGVLTSAELYEQVVVFPASLSFSNQPVGTASASQTVTLTNNEPTALSIASVAISGANASDFPETDNCVGNLSAGASCSINVTFAPTATGMRTASLGIANKLSPNPVPVPLTGTAIPAAPIVSLSSTTVVFGNQPFGTTSAAQAVTLRNVGSAILNIQAVALGGSNSGDFAIATGSTCGGGASLNPNSSCAFQITFTPTGSGTRSATVGITDNAADSPQTINLSGTGQDFSMTSSTPTATIAAGNTATYFVSVSPAGGFNQTVSLSCTGAPSQSTCSVSPSSATLNGTSFTSVNVTVATTAPALFIPDYPKMSPPHAVNFRLVILLMVLLALALIAGQVSQHVARNRSLATVMQAFILLGVGIAMAACGGGGNTTATPQTGTPSGTYSITVSGTFSSGSTTLTHNTKLTLVVQ